MIECIEPISISKAEIPHQKLSEDNLQVLIVLNFITCSTDIVQILLFLCSILHVFSPCVFFASFSISISDRIGCQLSSLDSGYRSATKHTIHTTNKPNQRKFKLIISKIPLHFQISFNFQPSQHNNQQTNEFYVFFFDYLTQKLPTTNVSFTPRR